MWAWTSLGAVPITKQTTLGLRPLARNIQLSAERAALPAQVRVASKMLDKMKASPKSGWTIANIETACNQLGISCEPPSRGSHYKVTSQHVAKIVTIPHDRPIKLPYIRSFIALAEAHIRACQPTEDANDQS